ncbi:MAG TPA: type VI secretion system baseplate subunit TssK [Burkholderiaceae bacterium]|nr:type VI secretion system baseplate subunit TssK [Burkholderiaceae bacterium]
MSWQNKVIWTQGMFLLPHHFQQETRYLEHLIDMRVRNIGPHAWGFTELALDDALLPLGRLGIVRASGVLPDGTAFRIPQTDAAPVPLDVPADAHDEIVYLAAPLAREGVSQVAFDGHDSGELHRYQVLDEALRDHTNAADEPEPVQTGALCLRLLPARKLNDGYAALGIARVAERRSDQQVVLDRNYIAPQTRIDASGQLSSIASLLHGLIHQRAQQLASNMGQLGHGVSELAEFLMLQALNRAEPLLRQHAQSQHTHPETLHRDCLQLAGDLSTFLSETRHAAAYPLYRHNDLHASFAPLVEHLRRMLSTVLDRNALQVELMDQKNGLRTAHIRDPGLLRNATFVLVVNAHLPAKQLLQRFPAESKFGPGDRIWDLVNNAVPGITLRALPVAPRELPFHNGSHYFKLERGGDLWKQLERSGSLALHVGDGFPGLELALWAIRQ